MTEHMNIVPKIREFTPAGGALHIPETLDVINEGFEGYVTEAFFARTGLRDGGSLPLRLVRETLGEGAYRLSISESGITVAAETENGVINALTTLYLASGKDRCLPCGELSDAPRCPWRGMHIDCSRHFFSIEELKRVLEAAALVKINVFHWHLSDDQGFRVRTEAYPALWQQSGEDSYTKDEIRDLVRFAKVRGIEVIPELDMPGHTRAITAAVPELSCTGEKVSPATCGGIYPVILCPGKEETFAFIESLLSELVPLFESGYFHLGSDEAPKTRWKSCPHCQKRIRENGLKDETALQGYFTRRVVSLLKEKYGKKAILWNDALEAVDFLTGEELIQYWSLDHKEQLPAFLNKGGSFIYSDMFDLYYDYVAAMSPMKRSRSCLPLIAGVDYTGSEALAGLEACTWSEYITDGKTLEERIFPRLFGMAENAWSGAAGDYGDYLARLKACESALRCVHWGSGDPKGLKKTFEKLAYAKTMSTGMDPEVRKMTVDAAQPSPEFMKTFREKMLR